MRRGLARRAFENEIRALWDRARQFPRSRFLRWNTEARVLRLAEKNPGTPTFRRNRPGSPVRAGSISPRPAGEDIPIYAGRGNGRAARTRLACEIRRRRRGTRDRLHARERDRESRLGEGRPEVAGWVASTFARSEVPGRRRSRDTAFRENCGRHRGAWLAPARKSSRRCK